MAKGKASKGKSRSASKPALATSTKTSAVKTAAKTAVSTHVTKQPVAKPTVVAAAPSPPAVVPGLKKRNVKRGAPPMLPRRMVRRPEPVEGAPPPPPRAPSPPGSLHAPARAPEGAEGLKQRLSTVMALLAQLRALKRTLNRQFFEAGSVLTRLSEPSLYQAKGYGTFENFVEREIERELAIGRGLAHDLVLIVRLFQRGPAEELGLEKLRLALRAIWPEPAAGAAVGAGGANS